MSVLISSPQNRHIKDIVKLRKRRIRDGRRVTVVEGGREALLALSSGVRPCEAYVCPPLLSGPDSPELITALDLLAQQGETRLYEVSVEVYQKIAYRGDSGGVVLIVPYSERDLESLAQAEFPFLAVVENVEKPGNLGAVLRSADAAGVDGLIISFSRGGVGTDIFNPNAVRASLGALFTVPIAVASTEEAIASLRSKGISLIVATPQASVNYTEVDLSGGVALVLGSEAEGVSEEWLAAADEQVLIPMRGVVDSLNVAVSAALLLYEAVRQRSLTSS